MWFDVMRRFDLSSLHAHYSQPDCLQRQTEWCVLADPVMILLPDVVHDIDLVWQQLTTELWLNPFCLQVWCRPWWARL
jgi:hypothetical protein